MKICVHVWLVFSGTLMTTSVHQFIEPLSLSLSLLSFSLSFICFCIVIINGVFDVRVFFI